MVPLAGRTGRSLAPGSARPCATDCRCVERLAITPGSKRSHVKATCIIEGRIGNWTTFLGEMAAPHAGCPRGDPVLTGRWPSGSTQSGQTRDLEKHEVVFLFASYSPIKVFRSRKSSVSI